MKIDRRGFLKFAGLLPFMKTSDLETFLIKTSDLDTGGKLPNLSDNIKLQLNDKSCGTLLEITNSQEREKIDVSELEDYIPYPKLLYSKCDVRLICTEEEYSILKEEFNNYNLSKYNIKYDEFDLEVKAMLMQLSTSICEYDSAFIEVDLVLKIKGNVIIN